jgi:L-amino acid N-acyltransferase YncA
MLIRPCTTADASAIAEIYNYYIDNTVISFEEEVVSEAEIAHRIASYTQTFPWLVCEVEGQVLGYAYATKWRERSAYRYSVEVSVYVQQTSKGQGYGKALYAALFKRLAEQGCHVLVGGIALPNAASVGLHEYFGFQKVAHFHDIGRKFNQWVDVGYWQKILP